MTRLTLIRVATGLGLGLLLFWPVARSERPTRADYQLSETPFARIPLGAIRQTGQATFVMTVPTGEQWDRIRSHWSDPGIMVFAAPDSRSVYDFTALGIEVQVRHARGTVPVDPVGYVPYMRSVVSRKDEYRERNTGVRFVGSPGEDLTIFVRAAQPDSLPDGELTVKYEWSLAQKDHIVALQVEQAAQRVASWSVVVGVGLLAAVAMFTSLTYRVTA
jgi:hypothetical protein